MIASSPTPCLPLYRDALLFMLTGLPCLSYCPPLRFSTPQLFGPSFQNANPSVLLRLWLPRASFFNYTTTSVSPLSISVFGPSARNAPVLRLPCPNPCTPIQSSVSRTSAPRRTTIVQPAVDFHRLYTTSFNPFVNSFTPPDPLNQRRSRPPPAPCTHSTEPNSVSLPINLAIGFLRQEHESRIRLSVRRFEDCMALARRDSTCVSCGKLVPLTDARRFLDGDPLLRPPEGLLDSCGWNEGFWYLCSTCHSALLRGSVPKFSAENLVNVTLCQHYPDALKDLTLTEEYLIAKSHPVGVVVKLRPGGRTSSANYHALRGHFIITPQDPKPLLQILPSPELQFAELVKVFWLGKRPPSDDDLHPFLLVRKHKVLAALQYLVQYNPLYQDVTIDHSAVDEWPDDFIPSDLRQHVVCLGESDHHERTGYTVDLQEHNYENDWRAAEEDPDNPTGNSLPVTGSVLTDINGERQNPDIRVLNTIHALVDNQSPEVESQHALPGRVEDSGRFLDSQDPPVIRYAIRGQASLLNQWQDPHYLTSAFPALFPAGVGGHLDQRSIPVSLSALADWALRHHSRRTFMYLLYDVLQLRNSCLGNTLLIKRSQWTSVTQDLNSLTVNRLHKATEELAANQVTTDPLVRRLLRNITAIGVQVPGFFFQKLQMRAKIRGLLVREGMPAFWLTINPSDLQNPFDLVLAGVQFPTESFANLTSTVRQVAATSDPVAVARFFHYTCKAVLDGLLGSKQTDMGILGDVFNYFCVVESNGRGMLHLHALVWVRGNLGFMQLRDRILTDVHFANRIIRFLETVITHSLHDADVDDPESSVSSMPPSSHGPETDTEFTRKLFQDANGVARTKQLHSKRHTTTCFKYRHRLSPDRVCRFGMPRGLLEISRVDEHGIIHLARNHAWINPWNPSLASCIRSNHDISWIPTVSKSLSLLYYITNYAPKDDVAPWQMIAKAALLKQMIDRASSNPAPTAADSRLQQRGMDKFALRCFNSLSQDREISGVQVASTLLQLPSYYTLNNNFTRINLWWLRRYEPCNYDHGATAPANIFDNYKLRGSLLSSLCIFEYCMLVQTRRLKDATTADLPFAETHSRHHSNSSTNMSNLAVSDLDDFNLDIVDDGLVPVLTHSDPLPDLVERRSRVGQNPTGAALTLFMRETIPLNETQHVVVEKVLSDVLGCANHPYDYSQRNQTLLYIGGEGGVGKSQIIKAIDTAMGLIHRKDELILMAPTGAAADVIGGSTYHASLGISLNRYRRTGVGTRVRRLWSWKTIMIIDEASMIDLFALSIINMRCKIARSLDRSSTDLFGGLPVVILMGDFHQFPPVQGQPLWKLPRNETEQDGKLI
ncbi:hypothetical protein PDE_04014 [Penicillium oxalicum 114-2]|uniref:ATP-dependent DNA helicase n=1 Tax=Penicillium oxalicum (strain 114-2 / CGMCC 5302) TaxID=933388 RepID=S7ZK53_PENO1|nr:hypothetical protein PDE_04014 [Penicillium oxalicum 114-2]